MPGSDDDIKKDKNKVLLKDQLNLKLDNLYMSHLLLLGKFEYSGGPIFKVVLEC